MSETQDVDKHFCERINIVIDRAGGIPKLSDMTGLSPTVIHKYKNGQSDPSRARLIKLAKAGRVSVEWLALGGNEATENKQENIASGLVSVPIMNVSASAGMGQAILSEGQSGVVGVDEVWLRSLGLNPKKLFVTGSNGESMYPTINSGDYLVCSHEEEDLKPGDGIYFIRLEGDILVKRLQRLPGRKLKVSSDNSAYEPYVIDLNDGTDFAILGRVRLRISVSRV